MIVPVKGDTCTAISIICCWTSTHQEVFMRASQCKSCDMFAWQQSICACRSRRDDLYLRCLSPAILGNHDGLINPSGWNGVHHAVRNDLVHQFVRDTLKVRYVWNMIRLRPRFQWNFFRPSFPPAKHTCYSMHVRHLESNGIAAWMLLSCVLACAKNQSLVIPTTNYQS